MKVLISEMIWPIGIEILNDLAKVEYDPDLWRDRENLLKKIGDVEALIVRNQTQVNEELLKAGQKLKVIGRLGVGLDNINVSLAKSKNIAVVYARNANAISVAEYVLAAIMQASRPLYKANQDVQLGNWDRQRFTGWELYGKTLGLIGLGEIAHRVAKRAVAFGVKIVGYDPFLTPHDFPVAETGIRVLSFKELLSTADFISIHVPFNLETQGMFAEEEFKLMKDTAYIINTARGGIIAEDALLKAISKRSIAGAFLDVLAEEPVNLANSLLQCDNIYITPHIAGLTIESQVRTSVLIAQEVSKLLQGQASLCVV